MEDRDLYAGLIRLHILYHAQYEPIFGLGIMAELRRHGYTLSPGTLYPMLHAMERGGYLKSRKAMAHGRVRRLYTSTPKGARALRQAKGKVRELVGELFEGGS